MLAFSYASVRASADVAPSENLTLQPGDNFVGWVAEPIAVDDIFAQIPQANLIYRWDAEWRRWDAAIRGMGGSLTTVEPGMAMQIRTFGGNLVEWERPLTPAKGSVTLYSGVNWVTWLGREDWPLDQVARGIGKSLVSIRVGEETWAAPFEASVEELPTLSRGDAVEVVVNRDLKWLQPTGMMPEVVFVGDVSDALRDNMNQEIRELLDYFADTHGVETDFADTAIVIWRTAEDAIKYQASEPKYPFHLNGEALRIYLEHDAEGGGTSWGMHVKSSWWSSNPRHSIFKTHLTHEWFHYLQIQYTDFWGVSGVPPEWVLEGTAVWSGDFGIRIAEGHQTFEESREQYRNNAARTSVTLRSAEERNTPWQYELGLLAVDLLVERSGQDSLVEYFRLQHPQPVGSDRQWQVDTTLNDAFELAFGLSLDAFYRQFAAWRNEQSHRGARYDYGQGDRALQGSLHHSDGEPANGFWVRTVPYIGVHKSGRIRRTHVREDGSYSIDLLPNTTQRLSVTNDRCTIWLSNDGLTADEPAAEEHRLLDTRRLNPLHLTLPEDACRQDNTVAAEVLARYNEDGFIEVGIAQDDFFVWASSRGDGKWAISAPKEGMYHIFFRVGYCDMWYRPDTLVATRGESEPIAIGGEPVSVSVRVPLHLCNHQIHGRISATDDGLLNRLWLTAGGAGGSGSDLLEARADFSITVPQSGEYRLGFTIDGCWIYYSASGATSDHMRATPITVADADVTGIEFVVPADPASLCR